MLEPGAILGGKLRIEHIIGQGGMGVVAVAKHLDLDELVAVKVVHDEIAADAEVVERFLREARASAKLRSEHVCKVRDYGRLESGAPFLVMELLDGHDLGTVIEHAHLPVAVAADYVLQACVGIAEAHAAGFIHRDLKPRNLFVTRRLDDTPLVKVLDFGIAKAPTTAEVRLTKTTTVVGSPGYMSPEQLRSARDADARSDIWSLGVILYECVAGKLPFESDTLMELAVKIAMDPPVPLGPEVDPAYAAMVMRCLEKSPDKRYPSVAELADDLAAVIGPPAAAMRDLVWKLLSGKSSLQMTGTALPASGQTSGQAVPALGNAATLASSSVPPTASSEAPTREDAAVRPPPGSTAADDEPAAARRKRARARIVPVVIGVPLAAIAAYLVVSRVAPRRPPPARAGSGSATVVDAGLVSVLTPVDALVDAPVVVIDAGRPVDAVTLADAGVGRDAAALVHLDAAVVHADAAVVHADAAVVHVDAAVVQPDAAANEQEAFKSDMAKARNAMLNEDFNGALAAAEAALRAEPTNVQAHILATRAACRAGKPDVARRHASTLNDREKRGAMRGCQAPHERNNDE